MPLCSKKILAKVTDFLSSSQWVRLLRFGANVILTWKHQLTIWWNALIALSNLDNSYNYYWLARRKGRTCIVIAVIIKSLVWFAFCLLKRSLKHHYVSFCSHYCYIISFFFIWPIVVIVEIVIRWIKVFGVCNNLLYKIWWLASIWFQEY